MAAEGSKRRMAAILAADMVGCSRQMGAMASSREWTGG